MKTNDAANRRNTMNTNLFLLKKIYQYNKLLFFLRIFLAMLSSFSTILTILMPMYLLNAIISGEVINVLIIIVFFTIAFLLITYLNIVFSAYEKIRNEKIYVEIINEFLQKTIDLDLGYFDNTASYDKYTRAFGNCCKVIDKVNAILTSLVSSFFNIIFIISLLIWMDVYMFGLIVFVITATFLINRKLKKIDYQFSESLSEKNKQLNYIYRLFYIPQLVREMKSNDLSDYIIRTKQTFNDDTIQLAKKQVKLTVPYNISLGTLNTLETGLVALYFGISAVTQRIVVAEYFTFVNAFAQLKSTILGLTNVYTELYSNSLFANDYIDFLNSKEKVTLNEHGKQLIEVNSIEFNDVSFQYPNSNQLALENVSFKIEKGNRVAIVGKNGAGKTTIIKLLLRLYDPMSGQILINDINIKNYNTKSLRAAIQTLFQDFAMYAFSIKENITLGRKISDEDIWDALEKVELKEKIQKLNLSLETPITSQLYAEGVELSGGEAQKLAIARIYANNPKTFIMDEPTSNLDPHAEYLLYKRLMDETNQDSIVVVISHRLTLTYQMSKIIVIDQGKVIEDGTHGELMTLKGVYYQLYSVQEVKYTKNSFFMESDV